MKKRTFSATLSDEIEPMIKRPRLLDALSISSTFTDASTTEQSSTASNRWGKNKRICCEAPRVELCSSYERDDDGDATGVTDNLCPQVDDAISLESDDEQSIVFLASSASSISSPVNLWLADEEEAANNLEIIDLTEDASSSPCSPSNELLTDEDDEQCPVCLETFAELQLAGVNLLITRCGHVMCTLCSQLVLAYSSQCPMCRENIDRSTLTSYCILT